MTQYTTSPVFETLLGRLVNTNVKLPSHQRDIFKILFIIYPNAVFDNPDGTSLKIDEDYFGNMRSGENTTAGPFINSEIGKVVLKVW